MIFSSLGFIFIFLPIVLTVYGTLSILHKNFVKNLWLVLSSIAFYYLGSKDDLYWLLLSIIVNYTFAYSIDYIKDKNLKKFFLGCAITINISVLMYFKFSSTILENKNIVIPLGISFYTFQAVSYVVDVYRDKKALKSPIDVALYIIFFPQLIAGPIIRFNEVESEIQSRKTQFSDLISGMRRFMIGMCKKILLANTLGELADLVYGYGDWKNVSVLFLWLGIISYSLQIYFDFSGYSDMAIGLGRMFGFHFSENFNYPYISKSFTDFWRRWHISLSCWLKDYLYIPLGGAHCRAPRHIFNLFIVWLTTSIWHGARFTFLFWGMSYFVFIVLEKYIFKPENFVKKIHKILYQFFTLSVVALLWMVFRAETIIVSGRMFLALFGLVGNAFIDYVFLFNLRSYAVPLILGMIFSTPIIPLLKKGIEKKRIYKKLYLGGEAVLLSILFCVSISHIIMGSYNPFLYFIF